MFNFLIYIFLPVLIPLPLFYDLFYNHFLFSDEAFGHESVVPIPIGFFSFIFFFIVLYVLDFFQKISFTKFFSRNESLVLSFLLALLFLHGYFISELRFTRVFQLLSPLVFFMLVSMPNSNKLRTYFFNSGVVSFMVFISMHFISLFIYSENFFEINSFEFPMFFGTSIYQSLVSYPGVMSLYLTLVIYIISTKSNRIHYKMIVLVVIFLLLSTERKAVLFEVFLILSCAFVIQPLLINPRLTLQVWLKKIFISITGLTIFFVFIFQTPSLERMTNSLGNDSFTGGRLEIYTKAIDLISKDTIGFVFGFGGGDFSFHNFFLDLIIRIGVFAALIYLLMLSFVFFKVIKRSKCKASTLFVFCLMGQLLIQLMVNSPLTQPYYIANFCFILLYIIYYPKPDVV